MVRESLRTRAIVLRRTNYGEADRIVQAITPDHGKIGLLARGIRKGNSKLAGALEIFTISDITTQRGRGDLSTVTSARVVTFFGNIMKDYDRLQAGYRYIADVNRASEQITEPEWYELLELSLRSLDNQQVPLAITDIWYKLRVAYLLGQGLNLATDTGGSPLDEAERYNFDVSAMAFAPTPGGRYGSDEIKLLRLASAYSPAVLAQVRCSSQTLDLVNEIAVRAAGV